MKRLFQVLVALIGIFVVSSLILSFSLDRIVKSKIESTTAELLETSVSVGEVSVSILDGSGTINNIVIQNPQSFSDNPAVKLQQVSLKLDLSTLLSDVIVVEEILIRKPELYFEQKMRGNNLQTLIDNMSAGSSSGIRVVVDYLLVENGRVTLTTDIGGRKSAKAEFSQFEIEDIGRNGNDTMEQVMQQILEPVLRQAAKEAVKQGLIEKAKGALKELIEG